ncbi:hypothetical protein ACLMJK_004126 [Lecanora helva]
MPRQSNESNIDVSLPNDTLKFYATTLCTADQLHIEQEAWDDALKYAMALASWRVNSTYQEAMDLYMGNDSRGLFARALQGVHLNDDTLPS